MRKSFAAIVFALAAALAPSASAITFSKFTTIYIGSGVRDDGNLDDVGIATTFQCTNVSGVSTMIRFVVLSATGAVILSRTEPAAHGATLTASTHPTVAYAETDFLDTGAVEGAVNIESLQSGVFCTAKTISASAAYPDGVALDLVRVNPHPGTVE